MGIVLGANEGTVRLHNAVPRIFFIYTYKMHLKIVCMGGVSACNAWNDTSTLISAMDYCKLKSMCNT